MTNTIETNPAPNPFDNLSALRLDQSYAEHTVGVKKLLTTVPVRKPNRQDFVRVHPDIAYRLTPAAIIDVKEDREVYLVTPGMAQALPGEYSTVTLYTTINRQGTLHVWPVKLPTIDGRQNEWHRSAAEAAEMAMKKWVRVTSNSSLGAYEIFDAKCRPVRPGLAGQFLRGNSQNCLPRAHRGPCRSPLGAAASRDRVAVAELVACRRTTDPGGGDTARQQELAGHGNTTEPMHKAGATLPAADEASAADGGRSLLDLLPFGQIWVVDFEFGSEPGENPEPVCLVAWELRSGRKVRLWRDDFGTAPPYPTGPTALFVAYYVQRGNRLPFGARLAGARARPGPVHGVSQPNERRAHRERFRLAGGTGLSRVGRDWGSGEG